MLKKQPVEEAISRVKSLSKEPPIFLYWFFGAMVLIGLLLRLRLWMDLVKPLGLWTSALYKEAHLVDEPKTINEGFGMRMGWLAFLLPFSPVIVNLIMFALLSAVNPYLSCFLRFLEFSANILFKILLSINLKPLKKVRIYIRRMRVYCQRNLPKKISSFFAEIWTFVSLDEKLGYRDERARVIGYWVILFILPFIASEIAINGYTEERYLASKMFLQAFFLHILFFPIIISSSIIDFIFARIKNDHVKHKDPDSYLIDNIVKCIEMVENKDAWKSSSQRIAIKKELERIADLVDLVVPDNSFLADSNEYKNYSFAISSKFYSLGQWTLAPRKDTRETLGKTLNEILELFVDRDMDGIIALSIEPTLKSFPKRSLRAKVKNNGARLLRAVAPSLLVILFWKLSDSADNGAFISLAVYGFMFSVIIFLSEIDPKLKDNISYFMNLKFLKW